MRGFRGFREGQGVYLLCMALLGELSNNGI